MNAYTAYRILDVDRLSDFEKVTEKYLELYNKKKNNEEACKKIRKAYEFIFQERKNLVYEPHTG